MASTIVTCLLRRNFVIKTFALSNKQALKSFPRGFVTDRQVNLVLNRSKSYPIVCTEIWKRFYSIQTAEGKASDFCADNKVTIIGKDVPAPITDIEKSDFPDYVKEFLKSQGFTEPTIIQAQGWPIAMSGQNFVGIAQTGTGKTLGYLIPALIQLKTMPGRKGRGPRVLVLAPTRELARQIEEVAKDFYKLMNVRCLCIYGGVTRTRQMEQLQAGVDILIATPGRLNDFIDSRVTNLSRCSYVVLDEADRMLDMGFEPQIRKALEDVPHERQILMFSATWPKEVQYLAEDYLGEYVQVNVGSTELSANHNIQQHVYVCDQESKMEKFKSIMHDISAHGAGKILVFTNTKRFVDTLALTLRRNGWKAEGIHGDKSQVQRDSVINRFKKGHPNILVATDVAARGLDVDGVTHVINYDFPNTSEDYIHRIGRTGRQQNKGESHTLLTEDDGRQAKSLIEVLKEAKQEIPQELRDLVTDFQQNKIMERQAKQKFKSNRFNKGNWSHNRRFDRFSDSRY